MCGSPFHGLVFVVRGILSEVLLLCLIWICILQKKFFLLMLWKGVLNVLETALMREVFLVVHHLVSTLPNMCITIFYIPD